MTSVARLPDHAPADALAQRLRHLREAVALADGRLPPPTVAAAREVVGRAAERVDLGLGRTVVALAGSTGSGKSSLTNALAGTEVVRAGVLRPTTAATSAVVWPGPSADELLGWLGVTRRHAPQAEPGGPLDGLLLLDLPDDDSTVEAHRHELERVVGVADVVVWVTDPQKYADRVLHERELARARPRSGTLLLVLNQVDRLAADERRAVLEHLGRLLERGGLGEVPVLGTAARTGEGVDALAGEVARLVAARRAALDRLAADAGEAADQLAADLPPASQEVPAPDAQELGVALRDAAGVDVLLDALAASRRREVLHDAGWPPLRRWRSARFDRLTPLRMALGVPPRTAPAPAPAAGDGARRGRHAGGGDDAGPAVVEGVAHVPPVALARVEVAVSGLATSVAEGLPPPAAARVRAAAPDAGPVADDVVTRVAREVDAARASRSAWPPVLGAAQWLGLAALVVGAVWLLARAGASLLAVGSAVPLPEVGGLPVPTLLLVVGLVAAVALSFVAARAAEVSASRLRRRTSERVSDAVEAAADDRVLRPLRAELVAMERLRAECEAARGASSTRRRGSRARV